MSTYFFDQAWQKERGRLTALESLYDGVSRRLLDERGVRAGWRCLEVGGGAGGIARWLADRVGETATCSPPIWTRGSSAKTSGQTSRCVPTTSSPIRWTRLFS